MTSYERVHKKQPIGTITHVTKRVLLPPITRQKKVSSADEGIATTDFEQDFHLYELHFASPLWQEGIDYKEVPSPL